jgi:DNA-directed RNA polymerase subunit M
MRPCSRCGGVLLPKRVGGRTLLECSSCGYTEKAKPEDYKMIEESAKGEEVPVIEGESPSTLSITRVPCPRCGHGEANWWIKQTRGADEPSTRFYRCVKCGKVWREYS